MEWDPHSEEFELNEKAAQENDLTVMPPVDRSIYSINSKFPDAKSRSSPSCQLAL